MAGRGSGPDFVEALARGLDVMASLGTAAQPMSLREVADVADLARPTARRFLLTLVELGYVRIEDGAFALTPRVLELGMAYIGGLGLWEVARPHMEALVAQTGESSSMAQLDGGDIVYVARVAVPKIITLRVEIGTRFPALVTSQGKVLLAALQPQLLAAALREPSRSRLPPLLPRDAGAVHSELAQVRARGWALADEELAPGIRSVAVPVRDGAGQVRAAMNVTVHAAETTVETLVNEHLPKLLRAAGDVSADWARRDARPQVERPRLAPEPDVASSS
jgi:IclR family transcriptional regulator, pca regulon regulatory protein